MPQGCTRSFRLTCLILALLASFVPARAESYIESAFGVAAEHANVDDIPASELEALAREHGRTLQEITETVS